MKAVLFLSAVLVIFSGPASLAQDSRNAEAAARAQLERQREEYKRLTATVEALLESQAALQKRIEKLNADLTRVREEQLQSNGNSVTRDEFRVFVEKLQEIDRKREDDKKLILSTFDELKKLVKAAPVVAAPPRSVESAPGPSVKTFSYTVAPGNTLSDVINAYNEEYKKQGKGRIGLEDVKRVNPNLNPNLIVPGQVILIPEPSGK